MWLGVEVARDLECDTRPLANRGGTTESIKRSQSSQAIW